MSVLCKIKGKFDIWSDFASSIIDGSAICIVDIDIHVREALVQSDSSDPSTIEVFQLFLRHFLSQHKDY